MRKTLFLFLLLACGLCHALNFNNVYSSPRNKERDVRKRTTFIILHTTEAEAKSSLRKLSKNGEAHYCVDTDGTVYRIVDRNRVAYHCGTSMWKGQKNLDTVSLGIEVVGYHDKALTRAQYRALRDLVATLQKTYKVKDANVMPHAQVAYGAPNKWHARNHRGRKRCGMGYATPAVRKLLGLKERWLYDPDVRARRVVVGDSYLARVLYARKGDGLLPYTVPSLAQISTPSPTAAKNSLATKTSKVYTLGARQSPSGLVGNAVFLPDTWYALPSGNRFSGAELTEQQARQLPPGTKILVGYTLLGPVTKTQLPSVLAPKQWSAAETYYQFPGKSIRSAKSVDMQTVPAGTYLFVKKEAP